MEVEMNEELVQKPELEIED